MYLYPTVYFYHWLINHWSSIDQMNSVPFSFCFVFFLFLKVIILFCLWFQLKLRPTGRLNVQLRHFREGEGMFHSSSVSLLTTGKTEICVLLNGGCRVRYFPIVWAAAVVVGDRRRGMVEWRTYPQWKRWRAVLKSRSNFLLIYLINGS